MIGKQGADKGSRHMVLGSRFKKKRPNVKRRRLQSARLMVNE